MSCDRDGIEIVERLLARRDVIPWVSTLTGDQKITLCKMIHILAEKQARTVFIGAQIKQDFGLDVSVEDVEDLKDRFVRMYNMILRERN